MKEPNKSSPLFKMAAMNCTAIYLAIEKYYSESDLLPGTTGAESTQLERDTGDGAKGLIDALLGDSSRGMPNFLEGMREANFKNGKPFDGIYVEGGEAKVVDPWGNPYKVVMSYKGTENGETGGMESPNPAHKNRKIRKHAIVYSAGQDKKFETWNDNVWSWHEPDWQDRGDLKKAEELRDKVK